MKRAAFQEWLILNGMADKSARDSASRCSRIERVFSIDLDRFLSNEEKLKGLIIKIDHEFEERVKMYPYRSNILAPLRRAARLYYKFQHES